VTEEELRGRLDQLWGWAKAGKLKDRDDPSVEYYLMDAENVDAFTRHTIDLAKEFKVQALETQMRKDEQLRELLSYCRDREEYKGRNNEIGADTAYGDVADKLRLILDGER
jgi:hypothetical protein